MRARYWATRFTAWVGCVAFAATTASVATAQTKVAPQDDVVLAEYVWNGQKREILLSELRKELADLPEYRRDDYEGREGNVEYVTLMAESRVLLELAREMGLQNIAEINNKVEKYRRQLIKDEISTRQIDDKVVVTDEEVRAYYDTHTDEYIIPEQVRLISLAMTDQEKAQAALDRILGGEDLKEVVSAFSKLNQNDGPGGTREGDTGLFARNSYPMAQEFVDKAFEMEVGEMTKELHVQTVRDQQYYMLFRLEEHNQPRQQTFEEVVDSARQSAEREKTEAREKEWHQWLKDTSGLVVYPDRVPNVKLTQDEEQTEESTEGSEEAAAEETPKEPTVLPTEVDKGLVLAEYAWNGTPIQYTWGMLWNVFVDLPEYRQSRYEGREGLTNLLQEETLDELKLLDGGDAGIGSRPEDDAKFVEYRHQLMVEKLVKQQVDEQVEVTDEDIQAYYDAHTSEYVEPEKVRITCLTFTDKAEAESTLKEIQEGRDIKEAAKTLTEMGKNVGPGGQMNGDTNFFSRDTYSHAAAFTEAAFQVPVGEVTPEPIEQELDGVNYYMIFKVDDRTPERTQTLDQVRNQAERSAETQKRQAKLLDWLDGLRTKSSLVVHEDRVPEPPSKPSDEESSDSQE